MARPQTAPEPGSPARLAYALPAAMEEHVARLATPRHVREVGTPDAEGGGRVSIMKVRGRGRPFVANMTSDELYGERERAQEAARRRIYTRHTDKSYHRHYEGDPKSTYDHGKIFQGGRRGHEEARGRLHGSFDPILGKEKWGSPQRPMSAKSPRARKDISGNVMLRDPTQDRRIAGSVPFPDWIGKYDPIWNEWIIPPRGEKFRDRENMGSAQRKGQVPLPPDFGKYDPVKHEWIVPPEDERFHDREKHRTGFKASGDSGKHIVEDYGKDYGVYNPVAGEWVKEPADKRFGTIQESRPATGKKQVDWPDRIGKYDPIKNEWIIPPKDKKVEYGLSRGLYVWEEWMTFRAKDNPNSGFKTHV